MEVYINITGRKKAKPICYIRLFWEQIFIYRRISRYLPTALILSEILAQNRWNLLARLPDSGLIYRK